MRPTLSSIAIAAGVALPSSLHAENGLRLGNGATVPAAQDPRGGADELKAGLPPLVAEHVRIVGALAELFAAAEAERLLNAGLRLDPGPRINGRAKRNAMRPTLPIIALATGAALCTAVLAEQASPRPDRGRIGRRAPGSPGHRDVGSGRSSARSRRKAPPMSARSGASPGAP